MCGRADNAALGWGRDGFTLVEIMIVVAILAVVAVGLVGLNSHLETQNRIALTEHCLEILSKAVAEFHDITGHFPVDAWLDIDATPGIDDETGSRINGAVLDDPSVVPEPNELLYLQLSLLPQTREIIANLPEKLLEEPLSGATVDLVGQSPNTPYLRSIVDPWHTDNDPQPLNYQRDTTNPDDVFPSIWSSGTDGKTGSEAEKADDISNEN